MPSCPVLAGPDWPAAPDSSKRFNAGDIVIYPMGDANVLSSAPGMRGLPDLQEYARPKDRPLPIVTRLDNDGADYCHLVCGYFGCDARPFNPLLEALPRMLLSQMSAAAQSWLSSMLRVAAEEAGRGERRKRKSAGQACRVDVRRSGAPVHRSSSRGFEGLAVWTEAPTRWTCAAAHPWAAGKALDPRRACP